MNGSTVSNIIVGVLVLAIAGLGSMLFIDDKSYDKQIAVLTVELESRVTYKDIAEERRTLEQRLNTLDAETQAAVVRANGTDAVMAKLQSTLDDLKQAIAALTLEFHGSNHYVQPGRPR